MKTSTVVTTGALALAGFFGYSAVFGNSGETQSSGGGSGNNIFTTPNAFGLSNQDLAQLQNSGIPESSKKEINQIIRTVNEGLDPRLDKIDTRLLNVEIFQDEMGNSFNSADVQTIGGFSTDRSKKLANVNNTITFISDESGTIRGAYDNIAMVSRTQESAQQLKNALNRGSVSTKKQNKSVAPKPSEELSRFRTQLGVN